MRAAELQTILITNPKSQEYEGIYWEHEHQLIPLTSVDTTQASDRILLYSENDHAKLDIKELLEILAEFQERVLLFWNGQSWQPIYGVKESEKKLIV